MSPKLRTSARRKRRRLALPFIATFALGSAGACSGGPAPITSVNPPPPEITVADAGAEPMTPTPDAQPTAETDPPETDPPGNKLRPPPKRGGTLHVSGDGTCWWDYDIECPPPDQATCNPPPPMQVQCPELPPAPEGGSVTVRDDGTCWWRPDPPDCPDGVKCNPPPPSEVACPDDAE